MLLRLQSASWAPPRKLLWTYQGVWRRWRRWSRILKLDTSTGVPGEFRSRWLDHDMVVDGLVAADMNSDGRLDLVAIGGRTNKLVWYENTNR